MSEHEGELSRQDRKGGLSRRELLRMAEGALAASLGFGVTGASASEATREAASKVAMPRWWARTRSLYCPAFCGGAGSGLMQYLGPGLMDRGVAPRITSFRELPKLLQEARRLGNDVIYLVDYWEGGYFNKGDYLPRADLGGPEAFREGIRAVHREGGRIIVYFEAFIVSRETSQIGRRHGSEWAIQREDGSYAGYQDAYHEDTQYYLMWPGAGLGWGDALASLGERYLQAYEVDGFHLDSYGYQKGLIDHHPAHPDGRNPKAFDTGATELTRQFRERIRRLNPEAVVILEGNECPWLMSVADGTQAWSLAAIEDKPWIRRGRDKVFTSSRDLTEMERILATGWNVSLSPWWLQPMPDERVIEGLRTFELAPAEARWSDTIPPREVMGRLWWCYDVLWANGAVKRGEMDPGGFERIIRRWPFPINRAAWTKKVQAEWSRTVELLIARLKKLDLAAARTPGQQMRELVQQAEAQP